MQIFKTFGTRTLSFMPRTEISSSKTYQLIVTSDSKNKVIITNNDMSIEPKTSYYYNFIYVEAVGSPALFKENNFYTLVINNLTDNTLEFRDKIFCTDQVSSTFKMTSGIYTQHNTGSNEYQYYTAP
tara:strand:- start:509 stop:889 length:381 start_codon:yes stop_codon:yes gene_type:complete